MKRESNSVEFDGKMQAAEQKTDYNAERRYKAMKRYFAYTKGELECCRKPCKVTYKGCEYTAFANGVSMVLSKESARDIELFSEPERYSNPSKFFDYEVPSDAALLDMDGIVKAAKRRWYRDSKKELTSDNRSRYLLSYEGCYYKIGVVNAAYAVIRDGGNVWAWIKPFEHLENAGGALLLESTIGMCYILPYVMLSRQSNVDEIVVIDADDYRLINKANIIYL